MFTFYVCSNHTLIHVSQVGSFSCLPSAPPPFSCPPPPPPPFASPPLLQVYVTPMNPHPFFGVSMKFDEAYTLHVKRQHALASRLSYGLSLGFSTTFHPMSHVTCLLVLLPNCSWCSAGPMAAATVSLAAAASLAAQGAAALTGLDSGEAATTLRPS